MSFVTNEKLNYFAQGLYGKIKANFDAKGSADTAEANAKTYADGLNTVMDTRVDALETTVGNAESGLVKDVAILKGDKNTEGSVAYQVAQIVAGADASYDTLKEIADWIMSDQTGAAKMANDIKANADAITDLEALVGTIPAEATATDIVGYIAEYVQAQLTASDLSQYAKAEDFNALKDVVGDDTKGLVKGLADVTTKATNNESAIATLNGADTVEGSVAKAVKDGVTEAKAYTDTKDEAMNTKVTAVETKATNNESAIATLNGDDQTEGSVAKAVKDGVAEAKTYADGLNTTMDGRMTAVETKANANETAIGVLNGADTVEGSVAKALKDAKAYADGLAVNYATAEQGNKADAAAAAIGVETNAENGVIATGIYARLESLESVMGTASVKDDHGNVVTPATGVQKQIEDLQASQNEIITEAQIDEMINGLA